MEPILVQIAKNALFAPKSLFGPKSAFWDQNALLAQKVTFGPKVRFWAKSALWNSHELTYLLSFLPSGDHGARKSNFCSKKHFWAPKSLFLHFLRFWAPKCTFCAKVHFCVPMPRMLINLMEFWSKWSPFWPKSDFGRKRAFRGPKSVFGPKRRILGKMGFWAQKAINWTKLQKS